MYRLLPLLLTLAFVPGCGVVTDLLNLLGVGAKETGSSELKAFATRAELQDYLIDQIEARNNTYIDPFLRAEGGLFTVDEPLATPSEGSADVTGGGDGSGAGGSEDADTNTDFSQTTVQEEGVDESDVVKTDGTNVYVMANVGGGALLRIAQVSPPDQMALRSEVSLEGHARELYLHDGKVVALTETGGGYFILEEPTVISDPLPSTDDGTDIAVAQDSGITVSDPDAVGGYQYQRPQAVVSILDVSAPDAPVLLSKTAFDGSISSSRMIGGVLHLVVSNYANYYLDVLPMLGTRELDVSAVEVEELLPTVRHVNAEGVETTAPVVTHSELYRPTDPDGFGIVTVISLDVDADAAFSATGIVADPGLIYSSLNALYLTDTQYNFSGQQRETTDIYKFAYVDRGAVPTVTGSVPGRILNQYSMGEYDGHLRVATTVRPPFSVFGQTLVPHNNVYVLADDGRSLRSVGSVEDIAPRETIQACRFVGDRGYVVTFERIDPLYTLDLADPTAPRLAGELKVPGFSTFLAPMDENHLLAIGQYIPEGGFFGRGVELSIFDVTDFENPVRSAHVVLGQNGSASSEALRNPKALTYFREAGLVALPVTVYGDMPFIDGGVLIDDTVDGGSSSGSTDGAAPPVDEQVDTVADSIAPTGFEGLVVYRVSVDTGFTALGQISTRFENAGIYWSSFTRGVFIGDDVFAVTDKSIRGAPLADVNSAPHELVFPTNATDGIGGIATAAEDVKLP